MTEGPLKLRAEDVAGLTVISACLQDAVIGGTEFVYQSKQRRFVATFRRFMWERSAGKESSTNYRVQTNVHFDGVLGVRYRRFKRDTHEILELLTISGQAGEDGSATIIMEFSGGGVIQLEVECVACYLSDVEKPWRVSRRPEHNLNTE